MINLWKDAADKNVAPNKEDLLTVKDAVRIENIKLLENEKIVLKNKLSRIDLGGIAKGFAVDEAAKIFRAYGFNNFLIDAGGDVYVSGLNCSNKPWRVGIRSPFNNSKIYDIVSLSNAAVTTSGNYERYFDINAQRYSHIIDPQSGYPQERVVSATVIAPSAQEADVLSTALCVLDAKKGIELIDSFGIDHAALIIIKNNAGEIEEVFSKNYRELRIENRK